MLVYILAFVVILGGSCWQAFQMGQDSEIAKQARTEKLIAQVRDDAKQGAADAIAKIDIKQVTIQGRLQKEIQTNTVYRDCTHSPDGLRAINDALTNTESGSGSDSQLPKVSSTK